MISGVEFTYRESYVEGATMFLSACGQLESQKRWLDTLRLWMTLPQTNPDDCPFPPNADGRPAGIGTGRPNHTTQRTRCRGFSQGVEAALLAARPSLSASMAPRMQLWRDSVLKWRNKNSSRTRSGLPSPPAPPAAPHIVNS
jgi:hypothetical protein